MVRDIVRQVIVSLSAAVAIAGGFFGSGAAGGTRIRDAAGGAFSADATPIAPGGPAFSIWSVIYLGLVAYAIWQFLPRQRTSERQRRLGYWVAASLLLNAAWILSAQAGLLPLSVLLITALLAVLVIAFIITIGTRPGSAVEAVVADGTIGLYLGWVSVAAVANTAAALAAGGFDGFGWSPDAWGALLAAVAGLLGVGLAVRGRGRIAPSLSLCWGLAWVAVARLGGDLVSVPTAIAAIAAVVIVVIMTAVARIAAVARARVRPQGLDA